MAAHLAGVPPIATRLLDLEDCPEALQLPPSRDGRPYRSLLALLRRSKEPLGWAAFPVLPDGTVQLKTALTPDGAPSPSPGREPVPPDKGLLSIVIATCADPSRVVDCLESVLASGDEELDLIVVENRPPGTLVKDAIEARFPRDPRIRLVEEERRGLSSARNAGLAVARGELIGFIDDDVRIDPEWISAIRSAFAASPAVACVTGLILPLEFETPAQLLDERFANYGKGFVKRTYSLNVQPPDQPLFPYSAGHFGSGANMAFRTEALRRLGGFDPALGTGTPARGGEDLDICVRVLQAGQSLAYDPAAIVWHRHPETFAHVRRQVFDYGVALGAMLSKHFVLGPDRSRLARRAIDGIRYFVSPSARKNALRGTSFPAALIRRERLGLALGPLAYLASRVSQAL